MKKFILILFILFYTINSTYADPVVFLKKGEQAPNDGFLFDRQKEQQLRLTNQELDYYKSLSTSLSNINKLQEDNLSKFDEKIKLRDERIEDLRKTNYWTTLGSFVLGCAITTLIVFGVSNVQNR